jgi:DNA gyrase subunit B
MTGSGTFFSDRSRFTTAGHMVATEARTRECEVDIALRWGNTGYETAFPYMRTSSPIERYPPCCAGFEAGILSKKFQKRRRSSRMRRLGWSTGCTESTEKIEKDLTRPHGSVGPK